MMRHELGIFALDFIDNLVTDPITDEREVVNVIIAVAHRGEDSEVGWAYRTHTSDEGENVALLLDVLKAELQQP